MNKKVRSLNCHSNWDTAKPTNYIHICRVQCSFSAFLEFAQIFRVENWEKLKSMKSAVPISKH